MLLPPVETITNQLTQMNNIQVQLEMEGEDFRFDASIDLLMAAKIIAFVGEERERMRRAAEREAARKDRETLANA